MAEKYKRSTARRKSKTAKRPTQVSNRTDKEEKKPAITDARTDNEKDTRETIDNNLTAVALMPKDLSARTLLQQRAEALATAAEKSETAKGQHEYLQFQLGCSGRYGISYAYMDEVVYTGNITKVPCTPHFYAGVINHRGEFLNVLDLRHFFRISDISESKELRILVVHANRMQMGLLVDKVYGNEHFDPELLTKPQPSDEMHHMLYIEGILDGEVCILNIETLLTDPNLIVNESVA